MGIGYWALGIRDFGLGIGSAVCSLSRTWERAMELGSAQQNCSDVGEGGSWYHVS